MEMIENENNKKEVSANVAKARKRKGVDKWKTKKWFTVLAPATFNNAIIAHTPGDEPEGLMGRKVFVSARELTGNIKKNQLMLAFKVNNVQGLNAFTTFDAIEVQPSALRRLVRRRSSKVESVDDVLCKDGARARIKSVALSANKISRPQQAAVRRILQAEAAEFAAGNDFESVLNQCATSDPLAKAIDKARKIAPMKRVDVLKVSRISE